MTQEEIVAELLAMEQQLEDLLYAVSGARIDAEGGSPDRGRDDAVPKVDDFIAYWTKLHRTRPRQVRIDRLLLELTHWQRRLEKRQSA